MDKKLKAKWVKALRSGKFKQTRGTLFDGVSAYCCLGVLNVIGRGVKGHGVFGGGYSYAAQKTGLRDGELSDLNDGVRGLIEPKSFKQIATWIEKNL